MWGGVSLWPQTIFLAKKLIINNGIIYLRFSMVSTAAIYARETSTMVGEGALSGWESAKFQKLG